MFKVEFKNVGANGLDFTAELTETPNEAALKKLVLDKYPGADVKVHNGRVAFCNGHKGSYVNHGTYTVTEE
jgi:hypothetical protein